MDFSYEQNSIYDFLKDTEDNLVINASPGSGKTTSLLHCAIPALKKKGIRETEILVLMFLKAIKLEFEEKAKALGLKIKVSTFHGMGFSAMISKFGTRYNPNKLKELGKKMGINDYSIFSLIRTGKSLGVGILPGKSGVSYWRALADEEGMELKEEDFLKTEKLFQASIADVQTCDFEDMLFQSVYYKLPLKHYKCILVDEIQDISELRLEFLKVCCKTDRIVGTGDYKQSIFSWNGADPNAIEKLKTGFECKQLPLDTSWRCSRIVVEECAKLYPGMVARPGAPLGSRRTITQFDFEQETFSDDCFILCRINQPLVKIAFSLIKRGFQCRIQGKDIGEELVNFTKKWTWDSFSELRIKLGRYELKQKEKLGPKNKRLFKIISDKINVIRDMMQECADRGRHEKEDLFFVIRSMFQDLGPGVVLSTPHRVKGLERRDVFIFGHDLYKMPPWCDPEDEPEEKRISYVAISRAKLNITYVNILSDKKDGSKNKEKPSSKSALAIDKYAKGAGNGMDFQYVKSSDELDF